MTPARRLAIALPLLLVISIGLQMWRDRGWRPYEPAAPVMWMQAGPALPRATLEYASLVADVYWMRAVVYFGHQRLLTASDKNYDALFPLLNIVTTLDPRFNVAYRFGAIFLSEPYPGGPGRPDLAIRLLQRGIDAEPERWEFPHDVGFIYSWHYHDYPKAAEWLDRASRVAGAPVWLKSAAAVTLAKGGARESSRMLWRQMRDTAEISALKQAADLRLAQLDALDAIDALNEVVRQYKTRTGRFPSSWQELVARRVLRGVPLDPAGVPFVLDFGNEQATIAADSPLWPLPPGLGPGSP